MVPNHFLYKTKLSRTDVQFHTLLIYRYCTVISGYYSHSTVCCLFTPPSTAYMLAAFVLWCLLNCATLVSTTALSAAWLWLQLNKKPMSAIVWATTLYRIHGRQSQRRFTGFTHGSVISNTSDNVYLGLTIQKPNETSFLF